MKRVLIPMVITVALSGCASAPNGNVAGTVEAYPNQTYNDPYYNDPFYPRSGLHFGIGAGSWGGRFGGGVGFGLGF